MSLSFLSFLFFIVLFVVSAMLGITALIFEKLKKEKNKPKALQIFCITFACLGMAMTLAPKESRKPSYYRGVEVEPEQDTIFGIVIAGASIYALYSIRKSKSEPIE
jgi:hypothetical protein